MRITPEADLRSLCITGGSEPGDFGYRDEEGYLYLKARIKEIINKGEKSLPVR